MNTLKDRTWLGINTCGTEESWAQSCAGLGAFVWAAIAILARVGMVPIGAIELIFLFAPLVIVPLGMELMRVLGTTGRMYRAARRIQPIGAGLAVVALWLPPGRLAGALASGWMMVCGLGALSGVIDLFSVPKSESVHTPGIATPFPIRSGRSVFHFAVAIAKIDLAVGGAWFVASRLGMRPMGIQEPIGLLTAVHFHFAGFATALIAAAALQFAKTRAAGRWLTWVVLAVVGMPYVVAVGFVVSPMLKMVAGVGFSISVAALAVFLRSSGKMARNSTARILLQLAPACVFAGMVLAAVYAIADFRGSDVLPIPQMARTHGVLNAVGFCMCGLLGWLTELNPAAE